MDCHTHRSVELVIVIMIMLGGAAGCGSPYGSIDGKPDSQVFDWYNAEVQAIPEKNQQWIAEGLDAETRARQAWAIREQARVQADSMSINRVGAAQRRLRDRAKHGESSFEEMVVRERKRGLEGDALYEAIIEHAARPRSKHAMPRD